MTDIKNTTTNNTVSAKAQAKKAAKEAKIKQAIAKDLAKLNKRKAKLEAKIAKAPSSKKAVYQLELDSINYKISKLNEGKGRRPAKLVLKTWSKGLSKEASRITWEKKRDVAKDFVTIVVIGVILGLVFLAIDLILISAK